MKKMKKFAKISLGTIICLYSLNIFGFAENLVFPDVAEDHWAKENIKFATESNIIKGYENYDGSKTFKPENSVTKEEAITMIYRTIKSAKENSDQDYSSEYETTLKAKKVSGWAYKYVAYALKNRIIVENDLDGITDSAGNGIAAKRNEIAIWTEKALKIRHTKLYALPYEDSEQIIKKKEIDALYRAGIMKGSIVDGKYTYFYPESNVSRAEFAAVCQRIHGYLKERKDGNIYLVEEEKKQLKGSIKAVNLQKKYVEFLNRIDNKLYKLNFAENIVLNFDNRNGITDKEVLFNEFQNAFKNNKELIITYMSNNENLFLKENQVAKIDQIHIATRPIAVEGKIMAVKEYRGFYYIGIRVEGDNNININYYMLPIESKFVNKISVEKNIKVIVDGNEIIEAE